MSAAPVPTGEVPTDFIDLVTGARRLGELRWVEERLFEVIGGWVPIVVEPATKGLLASLSLHHAWHAELLAGVLPTLPNIEGVSPGELTRAPTDEDPLGRLVADAGALGADTPAAARIEQLGDITLPGLIAGHRALRSRLSPVGDGPAIRVLGLIERDLGDDLASVTAHARVLAGGASGTGIGAGARLA